MCKRRNGRNKNEELTNKCEMNEEVCDHHQRSMLKWLGDRKIMNEDQMIKHKGRANGSWARRLRNLFLKVVDKIFIKKIKLRFKKASMK